MRHSDAAQAVSLRSVRQVGDNVLGAGPSSKLEAGDKVFKAAQILLAVGLLFSFVGSASVFIPASWGVMSDIRCAQLRGFACHLWGASLPVGERKASEGRDVPHSKVQTSYSLESCICCTLRIGTYRFFVCCRSVAEGPESSTWGLINCTRLEARGEGCLAHFDREFAIKLPGMPLYIRAQAFEWLLVVHMIAVEACVLLLLLLFIVALLAEHRYAERAPVRQFASRSSPAQGAAIVKLRADLEIEAQMPLDCHATGSRRTGQREQRRRNGCRCGAR